MRVVPYEAQWNQTWDDLVAGSHNGTFQHSRKFLVYHGDRFQDRSLVVLDDRDRWVAVLPAALDPGDAQTVVSHPGATFGGLVHAGRLSGAAFAQVFDLISAHFRATGMKQWIYKAVPHIYHRVPAMEDLYHLINKGAFCFRRDLSACVDLASRQRVHQLRRRGIRKGEKAGVSIAGDLALLPEFWEILIQNLEDRHSVRPVHTLKEITGLLRRLPDHLELVTSGVAGRVDAGCLLFKNPGTTHCQYLASSQCGRDNRALDVLLEYLIQREQAAGIRFFNFGISTQDQGKTLNEGLHQFKNGFGGGTIVHEFYHLEL